MNPFKGGNDSKRSGGTGEGHDKADWTTRSIRVSSELLDWLDREAERNWRSTNAHLAYLLEQFRKSTPDD